MDGEGKHVAAEGKKPIKTEDFEGSKRGSPDAGTGIAMKSLRFRGKEGETRVKAMDGEGKHVAAEGKKPIKTEDFEGSERGSPDAGTGIAMKSLMFDENMLVKTYNDQVELKRRMAAAGVSPTVWIVEDMTRRDPFNDGCISIFKPWECMTHEMSNLWAEGLFVDKCKTSEVVAAYICSLPIEKHPDLIIVTRVGMVHPLTIHLKDCRIPVIYKDLTAKDLMEQLAEVGEGKIEVNCWNRAAKISFEKLMEAVFQVDKLPLEDRQEFIVEQSTMLSVKARSRFEQQRRIRDQGRSNGF